MNPFGSYVGRCFILSQNIGQSRSGLSTLTSNNSPEFQTRSLSQVYLVMPWIDLRPSACKVDVLSLCYDTFLLEDCPDFRDDLAKLCFRQACSYVQFPNKNRMAVVLYSFAMYLRIVIGDGNCFGCIRVKRRLRSLGFFTA